MKLLVKFQNRARRQLFLAQLDRYFSMLSRKYPVQFVLTFDADDAVMRAAAPEVDALISKHGVNAVYRFGDSMSKVEAVNADFDLAEPDWTTVLVASVDMQPVEPGYDAIILDAMAAHYPDNDGSLWFNDARAFNVVCLPVIGRKFYDRFGWVYHPSYLSLYCDNEMTEVYTKMGKLTKLAQVIIRHDWIGNTPDALHAHNEQFGALDKATFDRRQANGFPLSA